MRYKDLKQMQKDISNLNAKIYDLKDEVESITQKLSQSPCGSGMKDKIGELTTAIIHNENQKKILVSKLETAIDSLPDTLEGNCIRLRVRKKFSWSKIACKIGGYYSADYVRIRCSNYEW